MSKPFYVPPRATKDLLWVCIDLDGTLAEAVWPHPGIGKPIKENIKKLEKLVEAGYKPIIWTARHSQDYEMVESWLELHGIPYKLIMCGGPKPVVRAYFDDKAVNAREPDWLKSLEEL